MGSAALLHTLCQASVSFGFLRPGGGPFQFTTRDLSRETKSRHVACGLSIVDAEAANFSQVWEDNFYNFAFWKYLQRQNIP